MRKFYSVGLSIVLLDAFYLFYYLFYDSPSKFLTRSQVPILDNIFPLVVNLMMSVFAYNIGKVTSSRIVEYLSLHFSVHRLAACGFLLYCFTLDIPTVWTTPQYFGIAWVAIPLLIIPLIRWVSRERE